LGVKSKAPLELGMSIQYLKNALTIGSAKEAALYFDTVVPLDLLAGATERENVHAISGQNNSELILKSLLPEVDDPASFYRGHEGISIAFWGLVALEKAKIEQGSAKAIFDLNPIYVREVTCCIDMVLDIKILDLTKEVDAGDFDLERYRSQIQAMIYNGLDSIGFVTYSTWHDHYYKSVSNSHNAVEPVKAESVSVLLQGLDLVDADKMSWKKILEIRKDRKAHSELRDLRLFLHQDVSGMEREAALDKIQMHIERYQTQVRSWKLDTVRKSVTMVVSKEGLGLTALGTLASFALTGVPVDPTTALATVWSAVKGGAVLNLGGSAALQFAEAKTEKSKLDASPDSNVRYFQRIRND